MKNKKIKKISKEVIQYEIDALRNLKGKINDTFVRIVNLILSCKNGKLIISGVGKSGIIARKWAATLSSTGTQTGPSFSLEANTGYYTRTKYTALGQESEWSDVTYFITQLAIDIAKPIILTPGDDAGVPDFNYIAKSSEITNVVTTSITTTELVDATIHTPHQTFSSSEANYNSTIWDPVNNRIVIAYSDGSNNYGKMRTANMHFDGYNYTLQFSPEFTFNSSGTYDVNVVYAGNGKIVVSYLNTGANRSESKVGTYQAHLGQYSFGSPESITGSTTYASYMQSVYDPINDKALASKPI